jgi:hypothetical protein
MSACAVMVKWKFWIQYLSRRVRVFDQNEQFNYNTTHDDLGTSLMRIMLGEVTVALKAEYRRDWQTRNYQQLIYDFNVEEKPTFGIVSTAPEQMDHKEKAHLEGLGFTIPSSTELREREVLDRLLSRAMSIPLNESGRIGDIDSQRFVLTLDFMMKLLCIHERLECGLPCIMEGETGVSKTALTKMYAILVNAKLRARARASLWDDFGVYVRGLGSEAHRLSAVGPRRWPLRDRRSRR